MQWLYRTLKNKKIGGKCMKNKKLLSTILAATLVATTMAVPVMANDGGGSVEVDVGVATSVLRVEVPTTLAVQIDQYQLEQSGGVSGDCQIYSEEFSILNKGNVNVKVDVTSSVSGDVKNGRLATTKQAAKVSKSGDAWLAAAAVTGLSISGDAAEGYEYDDEVVTSEVVETYATLKETNRNVATFDSSGDAKQTFYLENASGDVVYKYAKSGDVVAPYAKFRELARSTSTASGDAAVTEAAKSQDVYVQFSGDATMTRVRKGSEYTNASKTFNPASGDVIYTISGDVSTLGAGDYMYGEGNVRATGAAAFRYIGVLAKGQTWNTSDIDKITITYSIDGIDPGTYAEANEKCVQGLYKETATAPTPTTMASVMSGGNDLFVRLVEGQNAEASKVSSVKVNNTVATYSVAASGAIIISGVAQNAGTYNVEIIYNGVTYTGSVTK